MSTYGPDEQKRIYDGLLEGPEKDLPFSFEEWESKAQAVLSKHAWGYISGGAGACHTMKANRDAFYHWRIVPRMLRDVSRRDLEVTVLQTRSNAPFMLAPVGLQSIIHREAELIPARAAAKTGIPFIVSTVSAKTMEKISDSMGTAPRWFQLYPGKDRDVTRSMMKRAEAAGYEAIVVTIDTCILGWRESDLRNGYDPLCLGEGMANYFVDPAFRSRLSRTPEEDRAAAILEVLEIFGNTGVSWADIEWIQNQTTLPIVLKGILHPEDAKIAMNYGVDGLIVSNHGGRQVDGAIASLDALPDVVKAVEGKIPVLLDGGVRRAADIIKAVALGASAVLIGRPYVYASAVAGEVGVYRVIRNLMAELDLQVALSGFRSIQEIDADVVMKAEMKL